MFKFLYSYKDYIKKNSFSKILEYNVYIEKKIQGEDMQSVAEILGKLDGADNTVKNKVENILVNQGSSVVDELVDQLQVVNGIKRGVVAMSLIRIGEASVASLKKAASGNKDFEWIAKYLISEINCSIAA